MSDPTYIKDEIDANPIWKAAFIMSEIMNDNAPIGWGKYIDAAARVLAIGERKGMERAARIAETGTIQKFEGWNAAQAIRKEIQDD